MSALCIDIDKGIFRAAHRAHAVYKAVSELSDKACVKPFGAAFTLIHRIAACRAGRCDDGGFIVVNMVIVTFPDETAAEAFSLVLTPFRAVCGVDDGGRNAVKCVCRDRAELAGYVYVIDLSARGEGVILKDETAAVERHRFDPSAAGKCIFGYTQAVRTGVDNELAQRRAAGECVCLNSQARAAVAAVVLDKEGLKRGAAGKQRGGDLRYAGGQLRVSKLSA